MAGTIFLLQGFSEVLRRNGLRVPGHFLRIPRSRIKWLRCVLFYDMIGMRKEADSLISEFEVRKMNPEADLSGRFRGILSDIHKELLKPDGWKKDGQNFRLFFDGTPISKGVIINFQKSQWNDASDLRFTINVGKKYAHSSDVIDPKFKEYECDLYSRKRPQGLCPKYKSDQWWSLTSATDCEQLKNEIKQYLADYAIPWLLEESGDETLDG